MQPELLMERFLLLRKNACCAVISQTEDSHSLVVLSPGGQFTTIYHAGHHHRHMTRFVPEKFLDITSRLLQFRNKFCMHLACCPRLTTIDAGNRYDDWIVLGSNNHRKVFLCPFAQRLRTIEYQYIENEDNCIEHALQHDGSVTVVEQMRYYPIRRLPRNVQDHIIKLATVASSNNSSNIEGERVQYQSGPRDSAQEATVLLEVLMTSLSALTANSDRYLAPLTSPTAENSFCTLTVVESVDGDVFMVSHDGRRPVSRFEENRRDRVVGAIKSLLERQRSSDVAPSSMVDLLLEADWSSTELEVEAWINASTACSVVVGEVILRLKGDYFTFIYREKNSGTVRRKRLHTSFLQLELQRQARILDFTTEGDVLWADELVDQNYSAPSTDVNVGEEALQLLSAYCKQALRLMKYREHVLLQSRGMDSAFGLSETNNTESTKATDADVPSCSSVSKDLPDGSHLTALLKHCRTREEAAPYVLCLADVPLNPHFDIGGKQVPRRVLDERIFPCDCVTQITGTFADRTMVKLDFQTQLFTFMLTTGENCSFTLGSYKRGEGIFASQACIPVVNNAFYETGDGRLPATRSVMGMRCPLPGRGKIDVALIAQYVRRVLAFHRWADTPAPYRAALEEHDRRNAMIARTATLQARHSLMLQAISAGELTVAQAREKTAQLLAQLDHLPHTLAPPAALFASPESTPTSPGQRSDVPRSPFANLAAGPPLTPSAATALVGGGSTIGAASGANSSLSYSLTSSRASSSGVVSPPARTDIHIVTPEVPAAEQVRQYADQAAGEYLYHSVRAYPVHNSFGPEPEPDKRLPVHRVTPDSTPQQRQQASYANPHNVYLPQHKSELPRYDRKIDLGKREYLNATYVQDILDSGKRMIGEYESRVRDSLRQSSSK